MTPCRYCLTDRGETKPSVAVAYATMTGAWHMCAECARRKLPQMDVPSQV